MLLRHSEMSAITVCHSSIHSKLLKKKRKKRKSFSAFFVGKNKTKKNEENDLYESSAFVPSYEIVNA